MKITRVNECPCVITAADLAEGDVYEKYDVANPGTVYLKISTPGGMLHDRQHITAVDLKFPRTTLHKLDMRVRKLCVELTYSEDK